MLSEEEIKCKCEEYAEKRVYVYLRASVKTAVPDYGSRKQTLQSVGRDGIILKESDDFFRYDEIEDIGLA